MLGPGFYFIDFQPAGDAALRSADRSGTAARAWNTRPTASNGMAAKPCGAAARTTAIASVTDTGPGTITKPAPAGVCRPATTRATWMVALGYDFSPDSRLEFSYLRLDQNGLEFPGMVFDINNLFTNGYELRYTLARTSPNSICWSVEGWYNRTPIHRRYPPRRQESSRSRRIPGKLLPRSRRSIS